MLRLNEESHGQRGVSECGGERAGNPPLRISTLPLVSHTAHNTWVVEFDRIAPEAFRVLDAAEHERAEHVHTPQVQPVLAAVDMSVMCARYV